MNKEVTETAVEILGRTFHVKCPQAEVEALQQAAECLEDKLRSIRATSQTLCFERMVMIAALNVMHELLAAKQQKNQLSQSVNQKLRDLKSKVDQALVRYTQMELDPAE
jgi:cell division protein ZapA